MPPSYDGSKPFPVVLVFHGGGSNAEQMIRFCGLNQKADTAGFVAVYPNGTGRFPRMLTWNGGNCCGYAMREKVDDVAFVRALLDDLAKVAKIDEKRIYATGMHSSSPDGGVGTCITGLRRIAGSGGERGPPIGIPSLTSTDKSALNGLRLYLTRSRHV